MGAADFGGDRKQKGKKKGLRRPKRRLGVKIDMTPMVDIAFLLLIFYMVSTVFAEPQAMEVNLPPSQDESPAAESKVLTLRVAPNDSIYWTLGKEDPAYVSDADLIQMLRDRVYETPGLITLVKISKSARYSRMVKILDAIEVVEYRRQQADPEFSYTFSLAPWTRLDTRMIEKVTGVSTDEDSDDEGNTP